MRVLIRAQTSRVREGSVIIDNSWRMLEEIEFSRLSKLHLTVEQPDTMYVPFYGSNSN